MENETAHFDSVKYIAMGDELDKLREEQAARLVRIKELRKLRNGMMAVYKNWKLQQAQDKLTAKLALLQAKVVADAPGHSTD
jgi:hypothetical protein